MLSYFAVVEKSHEAAMLSKRLSYYIMTVCPNYQLCFKGEGLTVLAAGEKRNDVLKIYRLAGDGGIIAGRLFRRSGHTLAGRVPDVLSEHDSGRIKETAGRYLTDNYWGRYAAFINNRDRQLNIVMRDPSGALPLYYFETDDYALFFSNGLDFEALGLTTLSLNNDRILSHVKNHLLDYNNTGFNEIKKVDRGGAILFGNSRLYTEQYWHPGQFVTKSRAWSRDEAAELLRGAIVECVGAWGDVFDRIGVNLSGGLDSSIVLASLRQAGNQPEILASHVFYPASAEADERRWALAMADHADVKLHCTELRGQDIDLEMIRDLSFDVEPINCLGSVISGQRTRQFADRWNLGAIFSGHGGDMIFLQGASATAEDYVWNHGWRWGALRSVAENALISRTSFIEALRETARIRSAVKGLNLNRFSPVPNSIVKRELWDTLDLNQHCAHWLNGLQNVSVGKAMHLANSWCVQYHRAPSRDGWEVLQICPLLSQPILEVIAQIPAYLFCLNGLDRGLARFAFRRDLPRSIASRQSKGSPNEYYEDLYTRHLKFFRESLCSGVLMQQGILDARALDRALSVDISENSSAKYDLLDLLDIEYWARWWTEKNRLAKNDTGKEFAAV